MTDLERSLRELAHAIQHPPTPDLASAVGQRLRAAHGPRRSPLRRRRLVVAVTLALLLPTSAVAAVAPLRDAVLEVLGIAGVQIVRTPEPAPEPAPLPPDGRLDLGQRATLARAASRVSFEVVAPRLRQLHAPDEVYHRSFPPGGMLSLVYRPRAGIPRSPFTRRGLLLTEFRGTDALGLVRKVIGAGTSVQAVGVGNDKGIWLAGRPHEFAYLDARGRTRTESLRLAGNTLLWQRGPLTLRLEGAISRDAALRIARTVR